MIIATWILSKGDCKTGIRFVSCGLEAVIIDTMSDKAAISTPKGSCKCNERGE